MPSAQANVPVSVDIMPFSVPMETAVEEEVDTVITPDLLEEPLVSAASFQLDEQDAEMQMVSAESEIDAELQREMSVSEVHVARVLQSVMEGEAPEETIAAADVKTVVMESTGAHENERASTGVILMESTVEKNLDDRTSSALKGVRHSDTNNEAGVADLKIVVMESSGTNESELANTVEDSSVIIMKSAVDPDSWTSAASKGPQPSDTDSDGEMEIVGASTPAVKYAFPALHVVMESGEVAHEEEDTMGVPQQEPTMVMESFDEESPVSLTDILPKGPDEFLWGAPSAEGNALLRELDANPTTTETSSTETSTTVSSTATSSSSTTVTTVTFTTTTVATMTSTTTTVTSTFTSSVTSTLTSTATSTSTTSSTTSTTATSTVTSTSSTATTITTTSDTSTTSETSTVTSSTTITSTMTTTGTATSSTTPHSTSSTMTSSTSGTETSSTTGSTQTETSLTATSTETSTVSTTSVAGTTGPLATTTEGERGTIEWALSSRPEFTCTFQVQGSVRRTDAELACEEMRTIVANQMGVDRSGVTCRWVPLQEGNRRLDSGKEEAQDNAAARMLSANNLEDGFFEMGVDAQSELEASVITYQASTLDTAAVQALLVEAGFEEIEVSAVEGVETQRDRTPWTTRGTLDLTLVQSYTDDQVGNQVRELLAQALSTNVTTTSGMTLSIDPSNITVYKRSNVSFNTTSDIGIVFFIDTWSAQEDLTVLGQLTSQDYAAFLQQIWDSNGVGITIDNFRVIYDVFGLITIKSDADALDDQIKLTNPTEYDIEFMKLSIRNSAAGAYDLGIEEIGVSVLNIFPYSTTANVSNRIELAYLYNPSDFDSYCSIAIEQETTVGQQRLELSLSYDTTVGSTIKPIIETFYQDPTLSCSGSVAEPHDAPDVAAAAYAILFALGFIVFCLVMCCAFYARQAMLTWWNEHGMSKKEEIIDEESPMDESSMNEQSGQHSIHAVRASTIHITLPGAEPGNVPWAGPETMVVQLPELEAEDEPEIERAAMPGLFKQEYGFEYADDEQDGPVF